MNSAQTLTEHDPKSTINWEALFLDKSLSYAQIARLTKRRLSTVMRKASELHLRYVRSGRKGPNGRATDNVAAKIRKLRQWGFTNREIAEKLNLSLTTITHAAERYGVKPRRRSRA